MRYSRGERLDFVPKGFNSKIRNKRIVLVGCGGIGSVLGSILVRSGFLNLVLVDNDIVDLSNLQRQVYFERDVGKLKIDALGDCLVGIDERVQLKKVGSFLDRNNIEDVCRDGDLIVDASDNFETRKVINEFCEKNEKDWLYCGAIKSEFVCCLFYGKDKKFFNVFRDDVKDEKCCDVGILPSSTFGCASLAYNLVLKYFLKVRDNKLIKVDLWKILFFEIDLV